MLVGFLSSVLCYNSVGRAAVQQEEQPRGSRCRKWKTPIEKVLRGQRCMQKTSLSSSCQPRWMQCTEGRGVIFHCFIEKKLSLPSLITHNRSNVFCSCSPWRSVNQPGIEYSTIFQTLPPECGEYRGEPLCLAHSFYYSFSFSSRGRSQVHAQA